MQLIIFDWVDDDDDDESEKAKFKQNRIKMPFLNKVESKKQKREIERKRWLCAVLKRK